MIVSLPWGAGGRVSSMVCSSMKRALPLFTRPRARLGYVDCKGFPASSTTRTFFAMGVLPCCLDADEVSRPFFAMGVIPTAPSHHIRLAGKSRAPISCLGWPATRSSPRAALREIHVTSYRGIVGIQTETGIPPGARIWQLARGGRTLPGRRNLALVPDPNVRGVPEPVHQRRPRAWRHEPRLAERLDLDAVRPEAD